MYFMVQVEQIVRYVSDLSKTIFLQEQDKIQLSVSLSVLSVCPDDDLRKNCP